jgi:hypothetical protein
MLTVNDFVLKFQNYTDQKLLEIHANQGGYSEEAKEAMQIVLQNKGGLEPLLQRVENRKVIENEIKKIERDVKKLGSKGVDASFIKNTTVSKILSPESVEKIIDNKYEEVEQELEDRKIKPRTILGSVIGGLIASIIGGILFGLQMVYTNRIFYIFIIGLFFLCYGIIKLFTKQSKNNIVVLLSSIISSILAIVIGLFIHEIYINKL